MEYRKKIIIDPIMLHKEDIMGVWSDIEEACYEAANTPEADIDCSIEGDGNYVVCIIKSNLTFDTSEIEDFYGLNPRNVLGVQEPCPEPFNLTIALPKQTGAKAYIAWWLQEYAIKCSSLRFSEGVARATGEYDCNKFPDEDWFARCLINELQKKYEDD